MVKKEEGFVPITNYKEFRKQYDYGDPNYSIYYKFFKRPISYPLTWLVYRYTNLRPNTLTYIGFIIGLISAYLFTLGTYAGFVWGAIAFFIFELFDDFDGVIARSKNIRSRRGGWLDILAGYIGKFIILAALSVGVFNATGQTFYLILGLITVIAYASLAELDHVGKIRFSVVVQKKLKFEQHKPDLHTLAGKISIASEVVSNIWQYFLIIACLTNRVELFVIASAIYYPAYAIAQFFYMNWKYKDV